MSIADVATNMPLTPEQQRRVEANRQRALERLKQKGLKPADATIKKSTPVARTLTPAQRHAIEANRQRALELTQQRQMRDATAETHAPLLTVPDLTLTVLRAGVVLFAPQKDAAPAKSIKPFIKRNEYIEYDLAQMKDTRGGFLMESASGVDGGNQMTLEEWQNQQKMARDPAPPMDLLLMARCSECGSVNLDKQLELVFDVKVCRACKERFLEKYLMLTKTECKEDYLLTDPELNDKLLLKRLEKANPHLGTFLRMQLFLRCQVEEFAFKKWGSPEGLDDEWARREEQRVARRDKKYEARLKEMRRRTRAEEYTRKMKKVDLGHVHRWVGKEETEDTVLKRCVDCGMEVEEIVI